MSSEEDKMPIRRENTLASLEKVPEELMDKIVEHAEAKRVADLSLVDRLKEGIEDVTTQISSQVQGSVADSNENEKEKTQEKAESPKPSTTSQKESKNVSNDPSVQLKQKLESGEKIKASELASEFIHFIQEESRGDKEQKKPEQQNHESIVHRAEEGVKTLVRKLSQTLEDMKEKLSSSREGSETQPHHHTLKEAVMDFVHEISDEMTLEYDQEYTHKSHKPESKQLEKKLAKFIPHSKPVETTSETKPLKSGEIASTHQIKPEELKGFTKVESEGESTSKPQQETKEEEKPALTSSTNPFDVLMEEENLNLVAGEGVGTDITNKTQEEEHSSLKDKAKGKIDNATAKISHKVDAAKSKVSSALGSKGGKKGISSEVDKENAPQVA